MSSWFDIKYRVARQNELEERFKRISGRSVARRNSEYETALANNDFRQAAALGMTPREFTIAQEGYLLNNNNNNNNKAKIIWNEQDFQIALNAFTRYTHNKDDGEWNRWARDVLEGGTF